MSNLHHLEAVVFDFDGVLNRNYDSTGWLWSRDLARDHGIDVTAFGNAMFGDTFADVLTGKADLRDRTAAVLKTLGCATTADRFLDYWFTRDLTPCHGALGIVGELRARGLRCVIGTNNERHHRQMYKKSRHAHPHKKLGRTEIKAGFEKATSCRCCHL